MQEPADPFTSPEEVEAYLGGETIRCLICGKDGMGRLGPHLTLHRITPAAYRERFGIPAGRGLHSRAHRERKGATSSASYKLPAATEERRSSIDWAGAIRRIQSGELVTRVRSGRDGMPTFHEWRGRAAREPEFAALSDRIVAEGEIARFKARRDWDGALARIRSGELVMTVLSGKGRVPSVANWRRRQRIDQGFAEQAAAAIEGRKGSPGVTKRTLALVEAGLLRCIPVAETLRSGGLTIDPRSVYYARQQRPEFASRVQHIWNPRAILAEVRAAERTRRKAHKAPARGNEQLRAALRPDEVYGAVYKAVSRLAPDIRDDVASDLVLAVLGGEIAIADLAREVGRFRTAHNRMFGQWTPSLDALIGDGGFSLGASLVAAYV